MWLNEDSPVYKRDLVLAKPFVNSSGMLGFAPDPYIMPFLDQLGAFVTNPISRKPRQPASNRACLSFPGGLLLHTGLPNPGISRAIALYKKRWAGAPLPVIIHLLVETPDSLGEMIRRLEGLENVMAVELGIAPDCDPEMLPSIMEASLGELPIILCLSPEQVSMLKDVMIDLHPFALHLVEPRGTFPDQNGGFVSGRLYGPAIFPLMLQTAQKLLESGHRLIVNGGVFEGWQATALLKAGVWAVGLGSTLWQIQPQVVTEITK
jgi:dihydroorotate dehydrogenase (NAD+) catalytic subunit